MPLRCTVAALLVLVIASASAAEADATLLDGMDALSFTSASPKVGIALTAGRTGQALRFTFAEGCASAFATGRIRGTPAWNAAAGLSFWVQGDGSQHCGALQLVWNDDFAQRYDFAFPIDATGWTRVVVPWRDLVPVLSNAASVPLDAHGARPPGQLGALWFGKWWYWRDTAAHAYAIDDLRLEAAIPIDTADHRPPGAPLARTLALLAACKPITVVAMGDSLTDTHHWSNHEHSWLDTFSKSLQSTWHVAPRIVNTAIGGTELRQNLVLMPCWLQQTPHPDLVVVEFGGNDWNSGMRGPAFLAAQRDAIQRIRRATGGGADVLVVATLPSAATWDAVGELAAACREAATAERAGLADGFAAFHALGKDHPGLFASDQTHLGAAGQECLGRTVADAIAATK
jgi:lysophospholipase L1-like esterase